MGEVGRFILYSLIGAGLLAVIFGLAIGPMALIGWLVGVYQDSRLERWRLDRWHQQHRSRD